MKLYIVILTVCSIVGSCLVPSHTQAATPSRTPASHIIMDGKELSFEVAPMIEEGVMMVPMRTIFEAFQAKVTWNEIRRMVTAVKGDKTIKLTTSTQTAYINEKPIQLSARPFVTSGNTMVPIRFISEALGALVQWEDKTKTVTITSAEKLALDPTSSTSSSPEVLNRHNLMSGGGFTFNKEDVYFTQYKDKDNSEAVIFKTSIQASQPPVVLTTLDGGPGPTSLQIFGGWLYYLEHVKDSNNGRLYQIREDGSEKTLLLEQAMDTFLIWQDWLYVVSTSEEGVSSLSKMKVDGSSAKVLVQEQGGIAFGIEGDLLFYEINDHKKYTSAIYSMRLDGTDKKRLATPSYTPFNSFKFENGWLYYLSFSYPAYSLLRVRQDGTSVSGEVVQASAGSEFTIVDDWLYYLNPKDRSSIYRARLDGTLATKVADTEGLIFAVPHYIFYETATYDRFKKHTFYMKKSNLDGSDTQTVYERELNK